MGTLIESATDMVLYGHAMHRIIQELRVTWLDIHGEPDCGPSATEATRAAGEAYAFACEEVQ